MGNWQFPWGMFSQRKVWVVHNNDALCQHFVGTRAIASHLYDICDLCNYAWRSAEYHRRFQGSVQMVTMLFTVKKLFFVPVRTTDAQKVKTRHWYGDLRPQQTFWDPKCQILLVTFGDNRGGGANRAPPPSPPRYISITFDRPEIGFKCTQGSVDFLLLMCLGE